MLPITSAYIRISFYGYTLDVLPKYNETPVTMHLIINFDID